MNEGFIKIYRSIKKNWIWENEEYLKAWLDILMMVNHQDNKILFNNQLILVKRGERITSQMKLAKRWKWSRGKVRNFLKLLESDEMIVINVTTNCTTLKVLNYNAYQQNKKTKSPVNNQQKAYKKPIESPTGDINKNDKECIKNVKHTLEDEEKSVCDPEDIEIIKMASKNILSEEDIQSILNTTKASSDKLLEKIEYMHSYEKDIGNVNAFLISAIRFDWRNNKLKKNSKKSKNDFHDFQNGKKEYTNEELLKQLVRS